MLRKYSLRSLYIDAKEPLPFLLSSLFCFLFMLSRKITIPYFTHSIIIQLCFADACWCRWFFSGISMRVLFIWNWRLPTSFLLTYDSLDFYLKLKNHFVYIVICCCSSFIWIEGSWQLKRFKTSRSSFLKEMMWTLTFVIF